MSNRLKLNNDKTQFIWLGTVQKLDKIECRTITVRGTSIHISTEVTCLGVAIDNELQFDPNIKRFAGRCFYQHRQLRSIRRSHNTEPTKTLVHAFISSHADY